MIVIQCTSMSSNVTPVTVKGFVIQVGHKTTLKRGEQIMLAYKQQESLNSGDCARSLFDNLMTMDELMTMLKNQYCRRTIYRWIWIKQGMPCRRIRSRFWFPKDEVILWLERN